MSTCFVARCNRPAVARVVLPGDENRDERSEPVCEHDAERFERDGRDVLWCVEPVALFT